MRRADDRRRIGRELGIAPKTADTIQNIHATTGFTTPARGDPPFSVLVFEPVHLIMQTRQFRNLHGRVAAEV